jgi:hypothetical protein
LLKKILTKTAYLKNATAKNRTEFLSQLLKRNLRNKYGFALALRRCQPTAGVSGAAGQSVISLASQFYHRSTKRAEGASRVHCTLCWTGLSGSLDYIIG